MTPHKIRQSPSMKQAAAIQLVSKYGNIFIQLIVTAILARILTPDDFGTVAIVSVFTTFFLMFSDMGIGIAVVQYRDLSEREYGELFGFSIVISIILCGTFCLLSFPISLFYNLPVLIPLCCLASLSLLFSSLNMVPNGLMLKDKLFLSIGIRLLVSTAIAGVGAFLLAFLGAGVYALVLQGVISSAIVLIWNVIKQPIHHISFHFKAVIKKIFSYSAYQVGFTTINYFSRNLDNLLIGKVLGADALGFYDKAYKLTTYPMTAFASVIGSVIQPFMAEHQNNLETLFDYWFRISKIISLVAAPTTALFFSASYELTLLMYGNQWGAAVPLLHALSFSIYFQMLGNPMGGFFQSSGRTDLMFRLGIVNTSITILALIIGLSTGNIIVISFCISLGFSLHIIPCAIFLIKLAFKQSLGCLKSFFPEIIIAILAVMVIYQITPLMPDNMLLSLLIKIGIIVIVFTLGYALFKQMKYFAPLLKRNGH